MKTHCILTHPDHELPSVVEMLGNDYLILKCQGYVTLMEGNFFECEQKASAILEDPVAA